MTIISIYFILMGLLTVYNGLNAFIAGAVTVAATGEVSLGESGSTLTLALLGAFLLVAGTITIVNAVALFGRKDGSRGSSVWVALLGMFVALICLSLGITSQLIALAISPIVIYLFALNRPMRRYFERT